MLRYYRGLRMTHTLPFQYTSLSNTERFPVPKLLANGLVRPPQVGAYSIPPSHPLSGLVVDGRLVSQDYEPANLRVSVTGDQDGVYEDQVRALSGDGPMKPTLLLIGKRLGHDNVNPLYYRSLKVPCPLTNTEP
jgi:Peptidase family C54